MTNVCLCCVDYSVRSAEGMRTSKWNAKVDLDADRSDEPANYIRFYPAWKCAQYQ